MQRVLFVCMGNICRSPTAKAVFDARAEAAGLANTVSSDSAGTYGYHAGEQADRRAAVSAARRGYNLDAHRARAATKADFETFDFIVAMDRSNYDALLELAPEGKESLVTLFLQYAPELGVDEVPDPYYGGDSGFEHVLDLCENAADGLIAHLKALG